MNPKGKNERKGVKHGKTSEIPFGFSFFLQEKIFVFDSGWVGLGWVGEDGRDGRDVLLTDRVGVYVCRSGGGT